MRTVRTRDDLQRALRRAKRPVGLVPTMGWLHPGHRALMARARAESSTVVATLFVNPRQFSVPEDLEAYPRDEARDLAICAEEGVDIVFAPSVEEVYPAGFDTTVKPGAIGGPLEGARRPGHFDGVATVVTVMLGLVGPERAYFGQKDFQQLMIVSRVARDLALRTQIVGCPTVREPDGLAHSSRNALLTPSERAAAPVLHLALLAGRALWESGERSGHAVRAAMRRVLATQPSAQVDYVSCADPTTLVELERVDRRALLSLAVRFGTTRLIDNELIGGTDAD